MSIQDRSAAGLPAWLESTRADLRLAWRLVRKNPGFTAIAVATLGLGIGANTAIFSVVDAVVLRQLPYRPGGEVVVMGEERPPSCHFCPLSAPNLVDYRRQSQTLENLAGTSGSTFVLTRRGVDPTWLRGMQVTPNFFAVFGLPAMVGRTLDPAIDRPGAPAAAVLSYHAWREQFGADPGVVGSVVDLDDHPCTIVGVMAATFSLVARGDIWVGSAFAAPMPRGDLTGAALADRGLHYVRGYARVRQGVSLEQANAEMRTLSRRLSEAYPQDAKDTKANLQPLRAWVVRDTGAALWMLLGAVGLILLIACANLANLLLARGAGRQREMATRVSLGAGRGRLIRQALTETLLLGVLGGALGLLLAAVGVHLLRVGAPQDLPRITEVRIDAGVLLFTLGTALVAGLLAGIGPAWRSTRVDPGAVLQRGGRGGDAGGQPLRRALVVAETALALSLLIGAGLMIRSFANLLATDPGFLPAGVLSGDILLPGNRYASDAAITGFTDQLLQRVRALPGVAAAATIDAVPFGLSSTNGSIYIEGQPKPEPGHDVVAEKRVASPDYFRTLRIPVLRGRPFDEHDNRTSARVVIVNQILVDAVWPHQDPIGKRLRWNDNGPWLTVVGVVGNVHLMSLDEKPTNDTYVPYRQSTLAAYTLVVRTAGDPLGLASALRRQVLTIDPRQPIAGLDLLANMVDESLAARRFQMLLIGGLALLALILASLGIYGVVSYAVEQRTGEIGVRMALGARRGQVLGLIFAGALGLTSLGIGAGIVISLVLGRAIQALLFGVASHDPLVYAVGAGALFAVSLLAAFVPARRAASIDPAITLRGT